MSNSGSSPDAPPLTDEVRASDEALDETAGPAFWRAYADKIGLPKAGVIEVSSLAPRHEVGIGAESPRRGVEEVSGEASRSTCPVCEGPRPLNATVCPECGQMPASRIAPRRGNHSDQTTAARPSARRAYAAAALLAALIAVLAVVWSSRHPWLSFPITAPTVPSAAERLREEERPVEPDLTVQLRRLGERLDAVERSRMHPFGQSFPFGALLGIIAVSALGALLMAGLVLTYSRPTPRDPADDSEPDAAGRRLIVIRLGSAGVGVCFAITAIVAATLAYQSRVSPVPTVPADGAQMDQLRREMHAFGERLGRAEARSGAVETRVDSLESRVTAADASAQQASIDADQPRAGVKQLERATSATKPKRVTQPARRPSPAVEDERAPAPTPPRPTSGVILGPLASTAPVPTDSTPSTETGLRADMAPRALGPTTPAKPALSSPAPSPRPATDPAPDGPTVDVPRSSMASTGNAPARSGLTESPRATELNLADKIREDWKLIKRGAKSSADEFKSAFHRLRDWMTRNPLREEGRRPEAEITGLRAVPLTTDR